jgi:hypothetical protein
LNESSIPGWLKNRADPASFVHRLVSPLLSQFSLGPSLLPLFPPAGTATDFLRKVDGWYEMNALHSFPFISQPARGEIRFDWSTRKTE